MEEQEMKRNTTVAVACVMGCGWLAAAPTPCVTATLADYIALGAQGCTLNGDVFANFSYRAGASGGAAAITADQIIVIPFVLVPAGARLNFSGPWSVGPDRTQESVISYTIVPPSGGPASSQLQLALGTASVAGIIGAVAVQETTNVGKLHVFNRCTEVCQARTNGSQDFDSVSVVLVTEHVHLSGGTGGASLSEFGTTLDRCPLCV
jgi:hypothetical protein